MITFIGEQGMSPYIALVAGISVGMIGNFAFSRYWVFRAAN
ncbi:hypothetical protein JCM19238_1965 [Vibrio ponticus]|nr:hypothetical protein JCM19238_1965 [Vibrio ponticus]